MNPHLMALYYEVLASLAEAVAETGDRRTAEQWGITAREIRNRYWSPRLHAQAMAVAARFEAAIGGYSAQS